ncbi:MAG: M4 family metallopeptidase [Alphaproteobacteria bacterium]|nr:M4 family metallopeptidase [Alphaproteobacteria bacterium]
MIRTTSLALLLAGLVACGQSNEFELSPLSGTTDEQLAQAEETAWQAMSDDGVLDGVEQVDVLRAQLDEMGGAHVRYQQYAGGFPVFGGEIIAHVNHQGAVTGYSDSLIRDIAVEPGIAYNQTEAKDIALALDARGMQPSEDQTAELVVLMHEGRAYLVWKVRTAFLESEPGIPIRFIDAKSGELVWEYDNLQTYSLSDSDKVTYDMANSTRYNRASVGDSSDAELLMTHDGIGDTLSFLSSAVGRDSFNGSGAVVKSYSHYSRNYVNAFWDGSKLTFGDGDGVYSNYLGVLDVAAHELGHGVTTYEANLNYSYESGALNEGASDILAAAVEAFVDGGTSQDTWDVGEDCWLQGRALRYMQYPSQDGDSRDHYSARYTGTSDNGGVHWNSGIANHWFYLLTEGGQHHNSSYRSGYTVQGVGITDAYEIFYAALANYMTSSTNFAGARTATESACSALGKSSDTCHSVSLAWYEVGVGSDPGDYSGGGGGGGGGTDTGSGGGGGGTDTGDTGTTDTGTTDTGSGGGTSSCPTGWGSVTGTLADGAYDNYSVSGVSYMQFELHGPSNADFDLYILRGSRTVASSTSSSSEESINYSSSASRTYTVRVDSYSGSGDYTLCYNLQ